MSTKIEYVDETWSPITGCSPISEGCKNCYARRMAQRLKGRFGYPEDEPFKVTFHNGFNGTSDRLIQPLKWKKPRMIFVCSMADLFHKDVQVDWIDSIYSMINKCQHHVFLILTKRPERMHEFFSNYMSPPGSYHLYDIAASKGLVPNSPNSFFPLPLPNLFCGVTAENQKRADERIPVLLQIPAAVRFVSVEPILEEVDLIKYLDPLSHLDRTYRQVIKDGLLNKHQVESLEHPTIDWVIVGPETGPGKRECKPEWIRDLYEQCKAAGIPFFDKTKKNWIAREFPEQSCCNHPKI